MKKLQKEDPYLEESQDKIEISDKLQEPKKTKTSKNSDEKENEGKQGKKNSFKTIVINFIVIDISPGGAGDVCLAAFYHYTLVTRQSRMSYIILCNIIFVIKYQK